MSTLHVGRIYKRVDFRRLGYAAQGRKVRCSLHRAENNTTSHLQRLITSFADRCLLAAPLLAHEEVLAIHHGCPSNIRMPHVTLRITVH